MLRTIAAPETIVVPRQVAYSVDINAGLDSDQTSMLVYDDDALIEQVFNLWMIYLGEEPFEPTLGTLIPHRLFETMDADRNTASDLEFDCVRSVATGMKQQVRVNLSETRVTTLPSGEGFDVVVSMVSLRNRQRVTLAKQILLPNRR